MRSRGNASPGSSASGLGHATSDALDHTLLGLRTRRGWVERPVLMQPMNDGSPYAAPRAGPRPRRGCGSAWAFVRSDRFTPRGVTPLTPIMGRATDPGENHDPGNDSARLHRA